MNNRLKGHGDINIEKFEGEIKGNKVTHVGKFTLAEGETTGHKHVITVPSVDDMDVFKTEDGGMFLVLRKEGIVTHEEHPPITVAPGTYRIDREREVDHFSKTTRKVID